MIDGERQIQYIIAPRAGESVLYNIKGLGATTIWGVTYGTPLAKDAYEYIANPAQVLPFIPANILYHGGNPGGNCWSGNCSMAWPGIVIGSPSKSVSINGQTFTFPVTRNSSKMASVNHQNSSRGNHSHQIQLYAW